MVLAHDKLYDNIVRCLHTHTHEHERLVVMIVYTK